MSDQSEAPLGLDAPSVIASRTELTGWLTQHLVSVLAEGATMTDDQLAAARLLWDILSFDPEPARIAARHAARMEMEAYQARRQVNQASTTPRAASTDTA